jgi:trimeric autotransporter adhesin
MIKKNFKAILLLLSAIVINANLNAAPVAKSPAKVSEAAAPSEVQTTMTTDSITELTSDQIQELTADQIKALTTAQLKAFTADQFKAFTAEQLENFTPAQIAIIDANHN